LLPVPAGRAWRWTGMLDPARLPVSYNPAKGWLATANEMNLPAGYPHLLGLEWADRSRINRINEVIAAKPQFSLVDAMALQTDTVSDNARRMMALLAGLAGRNDDERAALAMLKGWDGNEGAGSAQALLYEYWASTALGPAAVAALVPQSARAGFGKASASNIVPVLEDGALLGPDAAAKRAEILLGSLGTAYAALVSSKGDPALWRWGGAHRAYFVPALALPDRGEGRSAGPLGIGGSGSTPMAASYDDNFRVTAGASVRLVMDVGAWDNAMVINTPGQSGNAGDPHYRDLFPLWAGGDYVPFRWSREAVDAAAERVINAVPQ
ncbi:penicillin acylase family protein, partial [Sandarakinorhabdus sp.]|uniref:penicillin acylase family protein n=1 Tax=Sandarakinorhabdus sp. TaxID=1916663 RepID=UPI00286D8ED0